MRGHRFHILMCLLLWGGVALTAANILRVSSFDGRYYTVPDPQGADHIYAFSSALQANFETANGQNANWTDLTTGQVYSNMNTFINVEDGHCYKVEQGAEQETFVVIDYSLHRLSGKDVRVVPDCEETNFTIEGLSPIRYTSDSLNMAGTYVQMTLPYQMVLTYDDKKWQETDWLNYSYKDSLALSDPSHFSIRPLMDDARFTLTEVQFSEVLLGTADKIETPVVEAVAVGLFPVHTTTTRGEAIENENMRPISDSVLSGSAPLDIYFQAHPSPKAEYFVWTIKRENELLTTRTEANIRYIFDDANSAGTTQYQVSLIVGNAHCADSSYSATVTLHTSMLLVPNVFTPDCSPGQNDEFRVVYRSLASFRCWVFNRWGHQVFTWNDPAKGWNGRINGRKAPVGAYYYIIEATGTDGVKYKRKGAVNLIRNEK